MGLLHAGILNSFPSCRVTSIAEKEGMLTRFAKKLLPNLEFYPSLEEMLIKERELSAIYVTTPIVSHLPIIRELAQYGKRIGVFLEKPLAGCYSDAQSIVELSEKAGLKGMVGFQKRFSPIFRKASNLLQSGVLGDLSSFSAYSYVSGVFSEGKGWRFKSGQGGALLDLGPHLIDILLWYFGEPIQVEGSVKSIYSTEVDDAADAKMKFKTGLLGSFSISWSVEGFRLPEIGIDIQGTNGRLLVTDDYLKFELYRNTSSMQAGRYHLRKPEFDNGVNFLIGDPEYCTEDEYFINCLMNGRTPQPNFATGAKVNSIIEKVLYDSKLGGYAQY